MCTPHLHPKPYMHDDDDLRETLLELLMDLDGVQQSRRYHPEGDALYHSLQVFGLACRETTDRELWAAALLHDVGKAVDGPTHDVVGARLLDGLVSARVVWLVSHHLDLLKTPGRTRRRVTGSPLRDLERLRRWDLGGRSPQARVESPMDALDRLLDGPLTWQPVEEDLGACDDDGVLAGA